MFSAILRCVRVKSEQILNCVPDHINGSKQIHSFLKSLPAEKLWKGVTSVSNAGRKRGRGKSVRKMMGRNVNVGQTIGVGQANIQWPGLTTSIIKGRDLIRPVVLPPDFERSDRLAKLRDNLRNFRSLRIKSDERGWSGGKTHGKSVGHPDPIGEETFEEFNSVCMKLESVRKMTSHFGRMRFVRGIVFIGNGKGLAGFSSVIGTDTQVVLKSAKNRALKKLTPLKFCENRTVFHDFCCEFDHTRIFVYKRPEGFGLICHRAIRAMCQMIGIKDLYAKIEGSKNVRNIINAFMTGLLKQKTYEEMAEEKRLHLVEMSKENYYYPVVKASPNLCRTESEIEKDEILDYQQYCHGGKIILRRKKYVPFYQTLDSWSNRLRKMERQRNKDNVRKTLNVHYGDVQSFLSDKYPEANASYTFREYQKAKLQSKTDDNE